MSKVLSEKYQEFTDADVASMYDHYPEKVRRRLLQLRRLVLDVAENTEEVGEIDEELKWGQPSFLTNQTKSGSIVRVDQVKAVRGRVAMYFHCQTCLVDTFREMYPNLKYEGNRAILFDEKDEIPEIQLRHCVYLALTYKVNLGFTYKVR